MKRVLLVTQYYPPENGAAQVRLGAWSEWLNQNQVDVEVICPFPNYPEGIVRKEDQGKIYEKSTELRFYREHTVHRLWLFAAMGKGMARLLAYMSFCLMCFAVVKKTKKPDLVVVNSGPLFLALPGYFLAWWHGAPCNLIVADIWPRSLEYIGGSFAGKTILNMMKHLERWAYQKFDGITAVTEGIREYLIQEEQIPINKIYFLPNGVDLSLFQEKKPNSIRQKLGLTEESVLFVYPGNMGNAHALETILQVAHRLQNQKFHFLFIGGGSEKARLSSIKDDLQLTNVTFLDSMNMSELVRYLQAADIGLIHMKRSDLANETRPAKMFPMMAASLPLLFCGFGEGQRLISHQSELFCDPENPDQITKKILSLPPKEILTEYGQKNRNLVEKNFSITSLISTWWTSLNPPRP